MSRILSVCIGLFLLGCVECFSQQDSVRLSLDPLPTESSPYLKYKWLDAEDPNTCLVSLRNYAPPINTLQIGSLHLRTNWNYKPIFLTDFHPHASAEEYHSMLRQGLGFTYDPLNPYGVNSPVGSIIDGSINSFLMLMFPCK